LLWQSIFSFILNEVSSGVGFAISEFNINIAKLKHVFGFQVIKVYICTVEFELQLCGFN